MRSRAQKPSLLLRPCLVDWFEVIWDELRFLLRILILADVAADIPAKRPRERERKVTSVAA